jgi:hypothetical protein
MNRALKKLFGAMRCGVKKICLGARSVRTVRVLALVIRGCSTGDNDGAQRMVRVKTRGDRATELWEVLATA